MKEKEEKYTKYEVARILGARALQISMNAPLLIALNKQELANINYDPLKIAELEFNAGILPITVRRPFPKKEESEEEEVEEPVEKEEGEETVKEEKKETAEGTKEEPEEKKKAEITE